MLMENESQDENDDAKNHVNVYGPWRQLAEECSFANDKLIRFMFMYMFEDLLAADDEETEYPVFHLC